MPTLENLKTQIGTIDLLQSVVRTMKTLAAVSMRQQEKAIQTLSDYSRTIDMGLAILLNKGAGEIIEQLPVTDGKLGAVIIGSDQGLCGRFNEQVVSFALETAAKSGAGGVAAPYSLCRQACPYVPCRVGREGG